MTLPKRCWAEPVFALWLLLVVFLSGGCAVKAPDAKIGVVNPAGAKVTTYNLRKDYTYDAQGMHLKPKAKPVEKPLATLNEMLDALDDAAERRDAAA